MNKRFFHHRVAGTILFTVVLLMMTVMPAAAAGHVPLPLVPIEPPRVDPPPIPHTDVLEPDDIYNELVKVLATDPADAINPVKEAARVTDAQDLGGEPGVLDHSSSIAEGLTLFESSNICNNFNMEDDWHGETWTSYYAGWGSFAADDGFHQAKNVTFDREAAIGPGSNYDDDQASLKIASNQPYDAGVMSPAIHTMPGDMVKVRVRYLIYNNGDDQDQYDYASVAIIPKLGEWGQYEFGYTHGIWSVMEKEVMAEGDAVVVMLQGHSPTAANSNIYFDDVEIWINGQPVSDCTG